MKKIYKLFFLVFINLLILVSCETKKQTENPVINTSLVISNLSDEDFNSIGTSHITKDEFKKVTFILDMKHNDKISKRTINIPIFKDVVNSYDNTERYWFGDDIKIDNISENYAYYKTTFILYTGNLSKDKITNIFHSKNILVSYQKNNKTTKDIIKLETILNYK